MAAGGRCALFAPPFALEGGGWALKSVRTHTVAVKDSIPALSTNENRTAIRDGEGASWQPGADEQIDRATADDEPRKKYCAQP